MRLNCEQNRSITADWPSLPAWFSDEAIGKKKKRKEKTLQEQVITDRVGGREVQRGERERERPLLYLSCASSVRWCVSVLFIHRSDPRRLQTHPQMTVKYMYCSHGLSLPSLAHSLHHFRTFALKVFFYFISLLIAFTNQTKPASLIEVARL